MACSSDEETPAWNNTPTILNSTQSSGAMARETITISSVASREPQIVTIDSDSNEPTIRYGFGSQHPIVPPNLNDLNLPHNPFNVFATVAVIRQDKEHSLQSPEPSIPSPISTPIMNLSTIEGWETPYTNTEDNLFYPEGEPRRVYWDNSPSEFLTPESQDKYASHRVVLNTAASTTTKEKAEHVDVFSGKRGTVAAHLRGMRPTPTSKKDTLMLREKVQTLTLLIKLLTIYY